jgi:hypothetical protein
MNYNFTGSVSERRINLGSTQEIPSSSQLAEQARQERAIRQEIRLRHAAATRIQSVYRGRKDSQTHRQALYARLQGQKASDFLYATKLVSIATKRRAIIARLARNPSVVTLTKAEEEAFSTDDVLLKEWASRALQPLADSSESPMHLLEKSTLLTPYAAIQLLAPLQSHSNQEYVASLIPILDTILGHLQYQGAIAQAGYLSYFNVLSLLITYSVHTNGESNGKDVQSHQWCQWLIQRGLYRSLQAHLQRLVSCQVQRAPVDYRS